MATLTLCPSCGERVNEWANSCRHCGYQFDELDDDDFFDEDDDEGEQDPFLDDWIAEILAPANADKFNPDEWETVEVPVNSSVPSVLSLPHRYQVEHPTGETHICFECGVLMIFGGVLQNIDLVGDEPDIFVGRFDCDHCELICGFEIDQVWAAAQWAKQQAEDAARVKSE